MSKIRIHSDLKLTGEGLKYIQELEKLMDSVVCCGFQSGQDPYQDGAELVDVVAYNEFGTSDIPPRPFMKQSWENHANEINEFVAQAIAQIQHGATAEKVCNQAGAFGVGIIQEEIVNGEFAPNAPSTIKKKGSDHPLIDTGHMRQSVHYVIRKE